MSDENNTWKFDDNGGKIINSLDTRPFTTGEDGNLIVNTNNKHVRKFEYMIKSFRSFLIRH